ncbi:unnamed protein product [Brassicogethes aeneus]|uniref:PHD-type domain-containing protein n=1 Tax=Brassicogethes aeneus TaxID=1431903 RepID=A0A9P0FI13_BRAAE|nr:unnamed protein product [Brassicogethes aeneus]
MPLVKLKKKKKKMPSRLSCNLCNKNITKSGYKIQCSICKSWFHQKCAQLSEFEIRVLQSRKKEWICLSHEKSEVSVNEHPINVNIDEEVTSLETLKLLILELKTEVVQMNNGMKFINEMFEEEKHKNRVFAEIAEELKNENRILKSELHYVKSYINDIEREKISKNIVVNGVCEQKEDNIEEAKLKVTKVLQYIDAGVTEGDIEKIKIVPTNNRPLVIATLFDKQKRLNLLKNKNKKGEITGKSVKSAII